ncbi:TonB family protein [Pedobacter sp. HMF7647]|uniref:TonB family protein n=1 Tax=Hufsiella arboris TaxID=2695275 RepID=A0A7K1YCL9_9SPHI|nr:energy transducer TonB [Hufsiella arboris]MXV52332.1 TonB family protein [Hufsiella arboris]
MNLFKSDLYKIEWLDVVFENRNKEYGAYELRHHYGQRMTKALLTTGFLVSALVVFFLISKGKKTLADVAKLDNEFKVTNVILPDKVIIPKNTESPAAIQKPKADTKKFTTFKTVKREEVIEEAPAIEDLTNSLIGKINKAGDPAGTQTPEINPSAGNGMQGTETADPNAVFESVEKLPQFQGGEKEFYKYLSRNLRYPDNAVENNIGGRVFVSFIVERDGRLSNIKVMKGLGFGCDEEAMRVIKKSPAWIPGEQNGKAVRVQYTIPISFQMQ